MESFLGYWEVWHMVLATWLFFIVFRFMPYNKHKVFLAVLAVALAWELSEIVWNQAAYATWRAQFINSGKDMLAALIAVAVSAVIVKNRNLI